MHLNFDVDVKKKIICWGAGENGEFFVKNAPINIAYMIDKDEKKIGKTISSRNNSGKLVYEIKIYGPAKLMEENRTDIVVFITSKYYYKEIKRGLKKMGIREDQIFVVNTGEGGIMLDYYYDFLPRYNNNPHDKIYTLLDVNREKYICLLEELSDRYKSDFSLIPINKNDEIMPYWINGFLPGLDGATIYAMIAKFAPQVYFEIGSGNSTKFAAFSIRKNNLLTKIYSVDPMPRSEVESLCDVCYRDRLENIDLAALDVLDSGDILFVDNSHRCFMNSDVTVFFLEILPKLKSGVVVGIHDICLPYDYPESWKERYYSEQYLLATALLCGDKLEILLPSYFIACDEELRNASLSMWTEFESAEVEKHGVIFWFRVK